MSRLLPDARETVPLEWVLNNYGDMPPNRVELLLGPFAKGGFGNITPMGKLVPCWAAELALAFACAPWAPRAMERLAHEHDPRTIVRAMIALGDVFGATSDVGHGRLEPLWGDVLQLTGWPDGGTLDGAWHLNGVLRYR